MGRSLAYSRFMGNLSSLISDLQRTWRTVRAKHTQDFESAHDVRAEQRSEKTYGSQTTGRGVVSRLVGGLLHVLITVLSLLLFLIPRRGRPVRQKAIHELHPLSYLDALRGYLALMIFTSHTMPRTWNWLNPTMLKIPWLQFPFRSGFAALDIFFWISGYTVTYRIIGFIHTKKSDKILDAFASTIFRRYLRLFLPVLPVTFFTIMAVKVGLAIPTQDKANAIKEINDGNPVWYWIVDTAKLLNPFTKIFGWWNGETGSNLIDPYWSLGVEFRCSMTYLTFLVGASKMPSRERKRLIWLCIAMFFGYQAQWAAMAFLGMWFAECRQEKAQEKKARESLITSQTSQAERDDKKLLILSHSDSLTIDGQQNASIEKPLAKESNRLPVSWAQPNYSQGWSRYREPLLYALFLYSFVYLKDPMETEKKIWFPAQIINFMARPWWYAQMRMHCHLCLGAFMLLYPLDQLPALQRPLLFPFSQYLGELSFGIYAMHYTVRWIIWDPRYVKWQIDKYGKDKFHEHFWVLFPGYIVNMIVTLWAADLFRKCDMQVVRFCKYLEARLFE